MKARLLSSLPGRRNPQRRVRVLMKFLELIARDTEPLAELLSREHGKTIADARGDIQRGIEVIEFAIGIPHLMKGEFTDSAGRALTSIRCASRLA